MSAAPDLLRIDSLVAAYGNSVALHGVSLTVGEGEKVALIGANGAGKSTVLRSIIGALDARSGSIVFDGRDMRGISADRRARAGIGYCPEGRHVFPMMSVRENLEVAFWGTARDRRRQVSDILALFPALGEHLDREAWQLSGGQQQMLAIGRALMGRPRMLLLDEPSLGLSPRLTAEVFALVQRIAATGTAVLLAEQNASRALEISDRGYVLKLGRIVDADVSSALRASESVARAFLGG
jgi:branched-chain amino acid transport system ATP-binding protein